MDGDGGKGRPGAGVGGGGGDSRGPLRGRALDADGDVGVPSGGAGGLRVVSVDEAVRVSLAKNTRTAYRVGWNRFAAWCRRCGVDPMAAGPGDVADFLVAVASEPRSANATTARGMPLAIGTMRVLVAAINHAYREADRRSPAEDSRVRRVLRGLGRLEVRKPRRVEALREQEIEDILAGCDELMADPMKRVKAARDAAVIALGFAAALRRGEICGLQVGDVEVVRRGGRAGRPVEQAKGRPHGGDDAGNAGDAWTARTAWTDGTAGGTGSTGTATDTGDAMSSHGHTSGMFVHIRRSKTDQLGRGQRVAVPEGGRIRPVARVLRWLEISGVERGPLFQTLRRGGHVQGKPLHPTDVARIVKRWVRAIGLDPALYSGHSLRAGFVTSAAVHHARLDKIMEVTRHVSAGTVLRYVRQAEAFEDHAGEGFL